MKENISQTTNRKITKDKNNIDMTNPPNALTNILIAIIGLIVFIVISIIGFFTAILN